MDSLKRFFLVALFVGAMISSILSAMAPNEEIMKLRRLWDSKLLDLSLSSDDLQFPLSSDDENENLDNKDLGNIYLDVARTGDLERVKILIQSKFDVNTQLQDVDGEMKTILHVAVESDNASLIEFLLRSGAKIDLPSTLGMTPLHYAAFYGYDKIAWILLVRGADIKVQDNSGSTPLSFAKLFNHTKVVDLLVKAGECV